MTGNIVSASLTAIVAAMLAAAIWTDCREHRIPNGAVLVVLAAALGLQILANGPGGLGAWAGGLLAGGALFLPFYFARAMGAGDVKLMAAAGSVLGPGGAVYACLLTLVSGMLLAFVAPGNRTAAAGIPDSDGAASPQQGGTRRIPYAAAIVTGTTLAMWQTGRFEQILNLVS